MISMATSMVGHVESNAPISRQTKEQKYIQSFRLDIHLSYFCKAEFLVLLALDEVMSNIVKDQRSYVANGSHVKVPSPIKMFLIATQ